MKASQVAKLAYIAIIGSAALAPSASIAQFSHSQCAEIATNLCKNYAEMGYASAGECVSDQTALCDSNGSTGGGSGGDQNPCSHWGVPCTDCNPSPQPKLCSIH